MNRQIDSMMRWIAYEVCHRSVDSSESLSPSEEDLSRLYRLSKQHDLAHLVGNGLFHYQLLPAKTEWSERFKKQILLATFRYEQSQAALEAICGAMEEAEIPFLPLKGSVLRQWYPEPWMRTSCDVDLLVHKEDLARASAVLTERLSYRTEGLGSHDLSLFSPNGVHVELHYDLVEDGIAAQSRAVLQRVWECSTVTPNWNFRYKMSDAMFYFYHVAHMAKHFEIGGCGVRPFIDLWILEHRVEHSAEERDALLERGGLLTFANACCALSEVWFSGKEANALSRQMQAYILSGGVYGSEENRVSVQQTQKGGKLAYAKSRIFLEYDVLKFHYPVLMKHKWLLPVMEVRRWGKLIFCGGMKRSARELKLNQTLSKDAAVGTKSLMQKIGLLSE